MANCINDDSSPVQPACVNLRKWPESDARSLSYKGFQPVISVHLGQPRVVDSRSCRQMYLRSYTFSRKESVPEKTKKCIGKVKERVNNRCRSSTSRKKLSSSTTTSKGRSNIRESLRRVSSAALLSMFKRLLSCTTKFDVVEHGDYL